MKSKTINEVWKKVIENSSSQYFVSNLGNCKRVVKKTGEQILTKGNLNTKVGYYVLEHQYVHRLVAKAFLKNQNNYEQVDHINSDRLDNRVENLKWVTRKQNNSSAHSKKARSVNSKWSSHTNQVIKAEKDGIVRYFKNGKHASVQLNCSHVLIYNAINHRSSAKRAKGWTLQWVNIDEIVK